MSVTSEHRGRCPDCRVTYSLRKTGKLWAHWWVHPETLKNGPCPGSGKKVEPL